MSEEPNEEPNTVIGEIQYTPVFLPDWITLASKGVSRLLRHVNHLIHPVPFDQPPRTTARCRELPFYQDLILLELTNLASVPAYNKYVLYSPRGIRVVDWTVEPIYAANTEEPLRLEPANIVPYVQFFAEYVFTTDGQRFVINNIDELPLVPGYSLESLEEALGGQQIIPAELTGVYEDGSFRVELFDLFQYDLSKSVVFVTKTGDVDWIVMEKVASDLPVQRRDLLV